jgi:hypothetical protein
MLKCFTKRSSVINSIYSGQQLFSYILKQEDTTNFVPLSVVLMIGEMATHQNANLPKIQLTKKPTCPKANMP